MKKWIVLFLTLLQILLQYNAADWRYDNRI